MEMGDSFRPGVAAVTFLWFAARERVSNDRDRFATLLVSHVFLRFFFHASLWVILLSYLIPDVTWAHGDIELRIEGATRNIERHPGDPRAFLQRADLHREHQDWQAAESDISWADSISPGHPDVVYSRAMVARDRGRVDESILLISQYLKQAATDGRASIPAATAHTELGLLLGAQGHWPEAANELSLAIDKAREPSPQMYTNLVEALSKTDRKGWEERALKVLDEAIRKNGTGSVYQGLAIDLELKRGNHDGALARIEERTRIPGYRLSSQVRKAEVLEQAGRIGPAYLAFIEANQSLSALPPNISGSPAVLDLRSRVDAGMQRTKQAAEFVSDLRAAR